jgi:G3E family GTPase
VEVTGLALGEGTYHDFIGLDLFNRSHGNRDDLVGDIDKMLANEQTYHDNDHDHHHSHEHNHHEHSDVNAFSIVVDGPLDEEKLSAWLQMLIMVYGVDLLRYKGVFYLRNQKKQAILQGVNEIFNIEIADEVYEDTDNIQSKIVIIGKDLPENVIKELFAEAV